MECLQFHAARGIKKIRAKIPSLKDKPDHVLIQVDFCGICGSDIHILDGSSYYKDDVILGHEITGTIVELGKNISTKQGIKLSIGTNVVVLPQNSCQQCYQCKQGRPNFCQDDNGGFGSTIGYYHNGGFAQYVTCHVTQVYPFDNVELPSPIATLCEPLQCVLNGFNKLESLLHSRKTEKLNLKILIIGFGICGYLWSLLLAEKGFKNINICEVSEKRWKIAKCFDHIDNAWLNMKIKDDGFDIVIECAGTVESTKLGYSLLNTSGIFIIFGGTSKGSPMLFDPSYILFKELTIVGSFLGQNTMQQAIETLKRLVKNKTGYLNDLDKLKQLSIIRQYRLNQFEKAFRDCKQGETCKAMFQFPRSIAKL